jgi:NADH dehydrogenase [ubiquinone] 1 alpha subcomplex assembly factor 6
MSETWRETLSRGDRDRYLTALFAREPERSDLMTLYAVNVEVAKIRESVSEPMIGAIKLQWWRDAIAGMYERATFPRGNPLLEALAGVIARRRLSRAHFDALLDARALDMADDAPADVASLETYADGSSARLTMLALEVLDVRDPQSMTAGRHVGIAWALTGVLRAVLFHARAQRVLLPESTGVSVQDLNDRRNVERIAGAVREIAHIARAHLAKARVTLVDRRAIPALLPATLADGYLKGLERRGYDVFDPRHALQRPAVARMTWNGLRGRF